ncbi:phospholipase D family protein [Shimia thalassica]|uniref:phospholipase D family protein n=1 Tax=Shimia thalassica TaxID=1715693 RepID=UPI000C08871E|nr:phospholipase D family protein [Shimia thalassica]MBU2942001.1 phospholipase D family protein [Shimia thalassica]MDO6503030.1 phospholipase D family protein [Shimia thalassica]PHO04148.1 hypothetical protein CSC82_11465 [Rhodobacteraceae bacterium 4F10]
MGVKYLTCTGLAKRIRKVMAGDNPWMCVAFLGPTWAEELFDGAAPPKDLRVVCDLRMGMTVQTALRVGGAPNNKRLRHLPDQQMHAKIYASDKGAIVCSANASHAALSSEDRIEDGVWLPPEGAAYRTAQKTFKKRYRKAVPVDADSLANAPEHLGASTAAAVGSGQAVFKDPPTLLQLLRHDPEAFKGIRLVFSNEDVSEAVKEGAKAIMEEELAKDGGAKEDGVAGPLKYDYFANWGKKETDWPGLFISVYKRSNGSVVLSMNRHLRFIPEVSNGEGETEEVFVAAKVRWNTGGAAFGDLRKLATVGQCATEMENLFQNGCKFADVTEKVLDARCARKALKLT